jgi:hypothetical protein
MKNSIVTKDSIKQALQNHDKAYQIQFVGRALVVLFNLQTESEQACNDTNTENSVGFSKCDSHSGCLTAKSFLKNKTLLDWQLEKWLKPEKSGYPRIAKYHKQLNLAAERKQANTTKPTQPVKPVEHVKSDLDWKNEFAKYEYEQEQKAFASKFQHKMSVEC